MLTGGGTGGHITPLLAVAERLKQQAPGCEIVYVGERGSKFGELTNSKYFDETYFVSAGKFRRYHSTSVLEKLIDVHTIILNIRDLFRVCRGIWQSWWLLRRVRPQVVFLKGGYAGLPIGIAAGWQRVPIVTHDSDVIPGLANRVAGRWAKRHAVAGPPSLYPYPEKDTVEVGVIVESAYEPVTGPRLQEYRKELSLPADAKIVLVTGGSTGAVSINAAVADCAERLLQNDTDLVIVHQVGKGKAGIYSGFSHDRLHVLEFLRPMASYMGAADLVVCRGSANTLAELAVQGKPAIVIPSPYLANGHQLKNAAVLTEQGSALVIYENEIRDPESGLEVSIRKLLSDSSRRRSLAEKLHKTAPENAADKVAKLIIEVAKP